MMHYCIVFILKNKRLYSPAIYSASFLEYIIRILYVNHITHRIQKARRLYRCDVLSPPQNTPLLLTILESIATRAI